MKCDICYEPFGENERRYWHRTFADLTVCKECFQRDDNTDILIRKKIARDIKYLRNKYGREAARDFYNSMRGSGVPHRAHKAKIINIGDKQ